MMRLDLARSDGLLVAGVIATELVLFSFALAEEFGHVSPLTLALIASAGLALLARRRWPVATLAGVTVLNGVAGAMHGVNVTALSYPLALYQVARSGPLWASVTAAAASVALRAVIGVLAQHDNPWTALFSNAAIAGITVLLGSYVTSRQRLSAEIAEGKAREAVADERRRIARELHDVVAHHISVMKVMSSAARANLTLDPRMSAEALTAVEKTAGEALSEMRRLLGVLRADGDEQAPTTPAPGIDDLESLVRQAGEAGLAATLEVTGTRGTIPAGANLAVYRVVQEALTNIRKHAGAGVRANVHLRYDPEGLTAEVVDDGVGPSVGAPGGGYGLVGMAERVALYGGTVDAGRAEGGGFRVTTRIPLGERLEAVGR
jgi:signal transduction histidine kinase